MADGQVNVFLTGVTGFVGRYLLYQLCEADWVAEVYVLIRPKGSKSAQDRYNEMLDDVILQDAMKMGVNFNSVRVIPGDLVQPLLGMSESDIALLSKRVGLVIHNGAALSFAASLSTAIRFNTKPSWILYNMCKEFELKPAFVYMGSMSSNTHVAMKDQSVEIPEKVLPFSAPAETIFNFIDAIPKERCSQQEEWLLEGRMDTYAFSKALIEALIAEDIEKNGGQFPVHLLRPSGIAQADGGPHPAWIHDTCFFGQLCYFVYKKKVPVLLGDRYLDFNMAPVDIVGNLTMCCSLEALEKRQNRDFSCQVVNGSSIIVKGMTADVMFSVAQERWKELEKLTRDSYERLYNRPSTEFKNPGVPKVPWYTKQKWFVDILFSIFMFFPLWVWGLFAGESKMYIKAKKQANYIFKYVGAVSPYMMNNVEIEHGHCGPLQEKYGKRYNIDASGVDVREYCFKLFAGMSEFVTPILEEKEREAWSGFMGGKKSKDSTTAAEIKKAA